MIDFYQVPVYELNRIKNGADYVTPEGEVIANARLTRPSETPRSYAYCSDTIYLPSVVEQIKESICYFMKLLSPMKMRRVPRRHFIQQPRRLHR